MAVFESNTEAAFSPLDAARLTHPPMQLHAVHSLLAEVHLEASPLFADCCTKHL